MDPELLRRTAEIATEYLTSLPERPVRAGASLDELQSALQVDLEDGSRPALQVIEELVAAADPGLVGTQSPRYFGFVIGGALDAAIAADWLTSVWDQNAAGYPGGPSAAVAEEVACEWLLDILGLPDDAGVGLTTGCQMAHFTCLAAARHRALADVGWDVEADGLFGAPPIRVLVGAKAHTTVFARVADARAGQPSGGARRGRRPGSDARVRARAHVVLRRGAGDRRRPSRRGQHWRNRRHGRDRATRARARCMVSRGRRVWAVGGGQRDVARARRGRCRSRLVGDRRAQVAQRAVRLWRRDRPRPGRSHRGDELVRRRGVHTAAAAR